MLPDDDDTLSDIVNDADTTIGSFQSQPKPVRGNKTNGAVRPVLRKANTRPKKATFGVRFNTAQLVRHDNRLSRRRDADVPSFGARQSLPLSRVGSPRPKRRRGVLPPSPPRVASRYVKRQRTSESESSFEGFETSESDSDRDGPGSIASRVRSSRGSPQTIQKLKSRIAVLQRQLEGTADEGSSAGQERRFSELDHFALGASTGGSTQHPAQVRADPAAIVNGQGLNDSDHAAPGDGTMHRFSVTTLDSCHKLARYIEGRFALDAVRFATQSSDGLEGYVGRMRLTLRRRFVDPLVKYLEMHHLGFGKQFDAGSEGVIECIACSGPPGTGKTAGIERACVDIQAAGRRVFHEDVVRTIALNRGRLTAKWSGAAEVDIENILQYLSNVPLPVRVVIVVMDEADAFLRVRAQDTVMNQVSRMLTTRLRCNMAVSGNRRVPPKVVFALMTNDIGALPPKIASRFGIGNTIVFNELGRETVRRILLMVWNEAIAAHVRVSMREGMIRSIVHANVQTARLMRYLSVGMQDQILDSLGTADIRPIRQCIREAQQRCVSRVSSREHCDVLASGSLERIMTLFPTGRAFLCVCRRYARTSAAIQKQSTVPEKARAVSHATIQGDAKRRGGAAADGSGHGEGGWEEEVVAFD